MSGLRIRRIRWSLVLLAGVLASCGDDAGLLPVDASTGGDAAADGAMDDGSALVDAAASGDAGANVDGALSDGAPPGDAAVLTDAGPADSGQLDAGLAADAGGPNCPNIFGDYSVENARGAGCADLNVDAPQRIDGNVIDCAAHFVSVTDGTPAINGGAQLTDVGSFSGASLTLGTKRYRGGCSGFINRDRSGLVVVCGENTGGTLSGCFVELSRQ